MEHDLAGSGLADAVVRRAYVDAALVPIHILDGEDVRVELLLACNEKCNSIKMPRVGVQRPEPKK